MAHAKRFARQVLHLTFLVQSFNVVLDALRLVLANGSADVRSDEECVQTREDVEHLVGDGLDDVVRSAGCRTPVAGTESGQQLESTEWLDCCL